MIQQQLRPTSPWQLMRGLLAVAVALVATAASAADFDYALLGNPADHHPERTEAGLALMGGGGVLDEAFRWFIQQAGGGDLVILKASSGDSYSRYLFETLGGCDSVETITFYGRGAASDPKIAEVLACADGIFLGGGAQWRYVDDWKGTPVARALDAHVKAGKPLGGSSAGLAVLGEVCYTAHVSARVTSEISLANPFDERLTFESDFLHIELMRGVLTDTHFSNRNRLGRLATFVARHAGKQKDPPLLGLGIDERTALCVSANGTGRVVSTAPQGGVWLLEPQTLPSELMEKMPLTGCEMRVTVAGPASRVNLRNRSVDNPISRSTLRIEKGELRLTPLEIQ